MFVMYVMYVVYVMYVMYVTHVVCACDVCRLCTYVMLCQLGLNLHKYVVTTYITTYVTM